MYNLWIILTSLLSCSVNVLWYFNENLWKKKLKTNKPDIYYLLVQLWFGKNFCSVTVYWSNCYCRNASKFVIQKNKCILFNVQINNISLFEIIYCLKSIFISYYLISSTVTVFGFNCYFLHEFVFHYFRNWI
jgi:hypothetical protein